MDCSATKERLDEYLDGELEPGLRAEVEEHLEACAACEAGVRAEQRVRARIVALAGDEIAPPALRERIAAQVLGEQPIGAPAGAEADGGEAHRRHEVVVPSPLRAVAREASPESREDVLGDARGRGVALASRRGLRYGLAMAAMLAGLVVLWTLGSRGGVDTALAAGLVADHTAGHGTTGREDLLSESGSQALSRWFESQIGRKIPLPETPPEGRLLGGQICLVNGERVAHAVYDVNGTTVSYYVLPEPGPSARAHGSLHDVNYVGWDSPQGGVFVLGSRPARELARFALR